MLALVSGPKALPERVLPSAYARILLLTISSLALRRDAALVSRPKTLPELVLPSAYARILLLTISSLALRRDAGLVSGPKALPERALPSACARILLLTISSLALRRDAGLVSGPEALPERALTNLKSPISNPRQKPSEFCNPSRYGASSVTRPTVSRPPRAPSRSSRPADSSRPSA